MTLLKKRLFVGNLPTKISQSDVKKKLGKFGIVHSVEMKQRNDSEGNVLSSFAFVDIETNPQDLKNCFHHFKNEQWHNQQIYVQLAKESFLERLKREQKDAKYASGVETDKSGKDVNVGKTGKLLTSPDSNRRKNTHIAFRDESFAKEITSPSECVGISNQDHLSKFESDATRPSCNREDTDKERNGVHPRLSGLAMFGGTKMIVAVVNPEISEEQYDIKVHKPGNTNDKCTKYSSQSNSNNLHSFSGTDLRNSCEVQLENVSEEEVKTVTERNKNLPMFCGSKTLIDSEKCDELENVLYSSNQNKINKQYVKGESGCLGSNTNSANYTKESFDRNHKPQNKNVMIKNSRNETKEQAVTRNANRITSVSPSRINEKPFSISQERNLVKPNKVLMAEKKRVNALEERKKALSLQKKAVKNALSNVDLKNRSNKKIIFNDDDDEEPENLSKDDSKPKLFQDSSDDEDIKKLERTEFKIKPQFEGRQGQKLLEIQSRYGHDSRFNLDERFLESDEETSSSKKEPTPLKEDLNAEKDHQLNILKEMFGTEVTPRKPRQDKEEKRDSFQMVRFDPSNPEHSKYLVKERDMKKAADDGGAREGRKRDAEDNEGGDTLTKKAKGAAEEQPVPVVMGRFYKVSDKLKESLRKRTVTSAKDDGNDLKQEGDSGGFSLLQKFGSPPSDNEEEVEYSTIAITRNRNEWEKNPFRYDSSEEDEEENNEIENTKKSEEKSNGVISEEKDSIIQSVTKNFYFQQNDTRLKDGLDFFGIKKTFAEMQEGFHERRTDLKLIIKAKVRNNKKRKCPLKKKLGGARKYKKKMTMYGLKR